MRIPGVGRKTAERLLVEMRDRLEKLASVGEVARSDAGAGAGAAKAEAFSALVALGYKPAEVNRLLEAADGGDARRRT